MDGVSLTKLKIIPTESGSVYHALKCTDDQFLGFGEAYFSEVSTSLIKGWKRHFRMNMNIIVPVGEIEFVLYDGVSFETVVLSPKSYFRMSVAPGIWMAFRGMSGYNLLLNISDIPHDPTESESLPLDMIPYEW